MDNAEWRIVHISRHRNGSKFHIVRMRQQMLTDKSWRYSRFTLCGKTWNYQNERQAIESTILLNEYNQYLCNDCVEKLRIEVITRKLVN